MTPYPIEEKFYWKLYVSSVHIWPFYSLCLKNFYSNKWIKFKIHIHLIKLLLHFIEEQYNLLQYAYPTCYVVIVCAITS